MLGAGLMLFITASVCVLRDNALLTVRKRGTSAFMLPGGKIEADESSVRCAVREAEEEIGLSFAESDLALIGDWTAPAANEPGARVRSWVYRAPTLEQGSIPRAQGEIDELRWHPLGTRSADLAPLLTECVLPALEPP